MDVEFSNGDNAEKESVPFSDLPTTPEIVKEGVGMFERVIEGIDNKPLRDTLLSHKALQACLLGIRPEIQIYPVDPLLRLDDTEWQELAESFEKVGDAIISLFSENEDGIDWRLLNKRAVEHVVKSHPVYFPHEAQTNPSLWLSENRHEWIDHSLGQTHQLRYGLLSGIPEWDVLPYEQYSRVNDLVAHSDLNNHELVKSLYSTLRKETPLTSEERSYLIEIFEEHFPGIGEEERNIFLSHTAVRPLLGAHFTGFDTDRDKKFVIALDSLVNHSELKDVIDRFSGNKDKKGEDRTDSL